MAVRHVREYFDIVANQYVEMIDAYRDLEKECQEGLVEPERLDNMKVLLDPIKENYMRISYIMYLLNKPNRESIAPRYEASNKKLLSKITDKHTLDGVVKDNKAALEKVKK